GTLRVDALREPVEVVRDRWGIPHITASSLHDLFVAQGFVMGQERTFQTDFVIRLAAGRLSELIGGFATPLDRFFGTVGLHRAGRRIAARYDDRSLEMADAMIAGLRAGVASLPSLPVEYRILELEPTLLTEELSVEHGAAVAAFMSWTLSGNWD